MPDQLSEISFEKNKDSKAIKIGFTWLSKENALRTG